MDRYHPLGGNSFCQTLQIFDRYMPRLLATVEVQTDLLFYYSSLAQDEGFAVADKRDVLEVVLKAFRVFGVNRDKHTRLQRSRQFLQILYRRVSTRMGVGKVDCRVAAVGGDLITAVVVGVLSIEIAEP